MKSSPQGEPSAKQRVLAVLPRVVCVFGCTRWEVLEYRGAHIVSGVGNTEQAAWEDAASKLSPVPPSPEPDWKQKVLAKWPEAYSFKRDGAWRINLTKIDAAGPPCFSEIFAWRFAALTWVPEPSEGLIKEAEETMKENTLDVERAENWLMANRGALRRIQNLPTQRVIAEAMHDYSLSCLLSVAPVEATGISAFFGKWPGDETDRELLIALDEVRKPEATGSETPTAKACHCGGDVCVTFFGKQTLQPGYVCVRQLGESILAKLSPPSETKGTK